MTTSRRSFFAALAAAFGLETLSDLSQCELAMEIERDMAVVHELRLANEKSGLSMPEFGDEAVAALADHVTLWPRWAG